MQASAYLSLMVTLGLALARPRLGTLVRVGPALAAAAGVLVMLLARVVDPADITATLAVMWRPLVAITSIMVTAHVAERAGVMTWLSSVVEERTGASAPDLFRSVFVLAALTAAVLNNDAAVLLLTPLVIALVRRRFPDQPRVLVAFVFAVFMAAGVAPMVISNPMNMIVAAYAGIDFNAYALRMLPIAVTGWLVAYGVLALVFRRTLAEARDEKAKRRPYVATPVARDALVLLFAVFFAYPFVAYAGGPVWIVAGGGALLALLLVARRRVAEPLDVVMNGVSWEILFFLAAVSVLGVGLRNAGLVRGLSALYAHGDAAIGLGSAVGSALLNNHPMAILNTMALAETPGAGAHRTLAALIGGDLGPRLLPMGSLAGLLWFDALREHKVEVSLGRFVAVGVVVTVPTLALSLAVLHWLM